MINELIFLAHAIIISIFALICLRMGSQALISFIVLEGVFANLFVVKQISLFGLNATGSDAFTIGGVLGLNLLQEYYGRELAKKTIWISFVLLVLYGIASQIQLGYLPATCDTMHGHFVAILGNMPRIVIASFCVYLLVAHIDSWLYEKLKNRLHGKFLILRNYTSIIICQFIDTILFSFLGLYGLVDNIWEIIVISYSIKLISILISTPFVALSKKLVNRPHP